MQSSLLFFKPGQKDSFAILLLNPELRCGSVNGNFGEWETGVWSKRSFMTILSQKLSSFCGLIEAQEAVWIFESLFVRSLWPGDRESSLSDTDFFHDLQLAVTRVFCLSRHAHTLSIAVIDNC